MASRIDLIWLVLLLVILDKIVVAISVSKQIQRLDQRVVLLQHKQPEKSQLRYSHHFGHCYFSKKYSDTINDKVKRENHQHKDLEFRSFLIERGGVEIGSQVICADHLEV